MLSTKVEKVRGMSDILPQEHKHNKRIERELINCFQTFGYNPVEVPIVEQTELFLRKSGEDIVSRLYDFSYQNRRLCLRPEMTASVIRAYVDYLQGHSLPLRLYYVGPVFRYEKPQRGRYRQFTQIGIELIGATGAMADAEVIGLACTGLDTLGINEYQVVIGHIGILSKFMEGLHLDNHIKSLMLSNMEVIRESGTSFVLEQLMERYPIYKAADIMQNTVSAVSNFDELEIHDASGLTEAILNLDEIDAKLIIVSLLQSMDIEFGGSRSEEEIVNRLLNKIKRRGQIPQIRKTIDFLDKLAHMSGSPPDILIEAEKLLKANDINLAPLGQLRSIFDLLESYDVDREKIIFDLGLSRGLQYYTGMIFEIYHGNPGGERQICGGGRYDDLVTTLGGKRSIPCSGFSYGLERLQISLEEERLIAVNPDSSDVLVIPVSPDDYKYGIKIAEGLRKENLSVEIDVKKRSVKRNFQYANKLMIPFVVVVGSEERSAQEILVKDMASGEEKRLSVVGACEWIKGVKNVRQ